MSPGLCDRSQGAPPAESATDAWGKDMDRATASSKSSSVGDAENWSSGMGL